ncbi:MAG: hypothetical protein H0V92_03010, partial [Pseudonocardiales bacterium]|nr:hypothetical protein [Pseudonocardiales bacterium]
HTHPKARPETPEPPPAPATGIAYLQLVAKTHHQQALEDELIGFHALYSTQPPPPPDDGQLPGQLSIDDALTTTGEGNATGAADTATAVRS